MEFLAKVSLNRMTMKEQLLHYIWRNKLFNTKSLRTNSGAKLDIIDFGKYNKDGGPDFLNAKIRVDDILLVGNIELHIKGSDWKLHKHDRDKKYSNVILHVVYFDDFQTGLPTLELNGRIPPLLLSRYEYLMSSEEELSCRQQFRQIDNFTLDNWTERLVIERLERKSVLICQMRYNNNNDWRETAYQLLGKYFGSHINKEPFEQLTRLLPYRIIAKHSSDLFQLESLLFGVAGMLNREYVDAYPLALKKEFEFLRYKYQLRSMDQHQWQFLRIRPISFPTIRLSWFAAVLQRFSLYDKKFELQHLDQLLEKVRVSSYWEEHYVFDKPSLSKSKVLGMAFANSLRINVFAPILYAYGRENKDTSYMEMAMELLTVIPGEQHAKVRPFAAAHWIAPNAFSSQAMTELYEQYCSNKRCLECAIGNKILHWL